MEITINTRQAIAIIWTVIAIVIAIIVDLAMGIPSSIFTAPPWWFLVVAFFGILLVITLPVYLLLALWGLAARPDNE